MHVVVRLPVLLVHVRFETGTEVIRVSALFSQVLVRAAHRPHCTHDTIFIVLHSVSHRYPHSGIDSRLWVSHLFPKIHVELDRVE